MLGGEKTDRRVELDDEEPTFDKDTSGDPEDAAPVTCVVDANGKKTFFYDDDMDSSGDEIDVDVDKTSEPPPPPPPGFKGTLVRTGRSMASAAHTLGRWSAAILGLSDSKYDVEVFEHNKRKAEEEEYAKERAAIGASAATDATTSQ